MARPSKTKVDYFPHVTHSGKTIAILEARWGNDGYAFWFKLLELLGDSNDFAYNCNHSSDWEYLLSKTRVTEPVALAILNKLSEIDAIDNGLWARKIVWSDNFVLNLEPVFEKRKRQAPQKPEFPEQKSGQNENDAGFCGENSAAPAIIPTKTDKVKEREPDQREAEEPEKACAGAGAPEDESVPGSPIDEITETDEVLAESTKPKRRNRNSHDVPFPSQLRPGVVCQADTVYLTPAELERLQQEYGEEGAQRLIEILDAYKTNNPEKGAKYRDDFKVIRSWVIRRFREELQDAGQIQRASPSIAQRPQTFNEKLAFMAKGVEE